MLELRELRRSDLDCINEWRQDRELIALLGAPYRYIGPEVEDAWFDNYLQSRSTTVRCVVEDLERRDHPLALVTLAGIDWVHRSASLHVMVGDGRERGRGVGTFAVREILRHAFDDFGLNRVELNVLASNERAIHVYEKCGFRQEGRKRQCWFKDGRFVDVLVMGVLREDLA